MAKIVSNDTIKMNGVLMIDKEILMVYKEKSCLRFFWPS